MLSSGIYDGVCQLVDEWPAGVHRSEPAYRDDLYLWLSQKVHHHAVKKEAGGSRADIGIGNRVAIELKYEFASTGQIDKLFSQITRHIDWFDEGVVCVLCGDYDQAALNELKVRIRTRLNRSQLNFYPRDRISFYHKD